jgi:cysteine synthase
MAHNLIQQESEGRANQPYHESPEHHGYVALQQLPRVGNTPVSEIPELSEYFGVKHLLIKNESANPFGTHKDRKSLYVVSHARTLCNGIDPVALCILTSGNAGLSLAAFASEKNLPVIGIVGKSLPSDVERQLEGACKKIVSLDLEVKPWKSEQLRAFAGETNGDRILDATNCSEAYKQIAREIAPYRPDFIVLPVGSGELFVGLAAGLRDLNRNLKLKTKLIGVAVKKRDSLADKLYAYWTPYKSRVQELTRSPSKHRLVELDLNDEDLLAETFEVVGKHLRCEPSSAAAFVPLRKYKFDRQAKILILNTGTGQRLPQQ